jgi:hypothetical protein
MVDLLEHTLLSAHDPDTGRLDALRLADTLAISTSQMARIVGYTPSGLRKNPTAERLQAVLSGLVDLMRRLKDIFDGNLEHARIWLKAPHPDLGGTTPLACLEARRMDAVETLVYAMETGQPL